MADIFISYAREDNDVAKRIAAALSNRNWSVFWDRNILGGDDWRQKLTREVETARSVLVLWSPNSTVSRWVKEEAEVGIGRGILVAVLLHPTNIPLGFRSVQTLDLSSWDGRPDSIEFGQLVDSLARHLPPKGPDADQPKPAVEVRLRGDDFPGRINELRGLSPTIVEIVGDYDDETLNLPTDFGDLVGLETLVISHFQRVSIPNTLGDLLTLKKLSIKNSNLTALPPCIYRLSLLEELDVGNSNPYQAPGGYNTIRRIEPEFSQLENLRVFGCKGAGILTPPEYVIELGPEAMRNYLRKRGH